LKTKQFCFPCLKQGVCHIVVLPFMHIKKSNILRQKKKNYGNSNISPCKNILFQKILKKEKPKIVQDIL
jgi:hypothetical protein